MAGSVYSNPIGAAIDSYATLSNTLDNQENSAIRRKLMEKEIEDKGLNNQRTKQLMRAGDLDIEHKKQTMAEEKRKMDAQKNLGDIEQEVIAKHPEGMAVNYAQGHQTLQSGKELTPDHMLATDYFESKSPVYSGLSLREVKGKTDSLETMGNFWAQYKGTILKGGSLSDKQAPEFFEAWNTVLGSQINKGEGGQKQVVGAISDPKTQSVTPMVEVTGPDGQVHTEPMTVGRGLMTPQSQVIQIPVPVFEQYLQAQHGLGLMIQQKQAWAAANPGKWTELQMEQKKTQEIGQMRQQAAGDLRKYREQHPGASTNDQRVFLMEHLPASMDPKVFDTIVKEVIQEKVDTMPPELKTFRALEKDPEEKARFMKYEKEKTGATTHIHVSTVKGGEAKLSSDQKRHIKDIEKRSKEAEKKAGEMDDEEKAERARTIRDDAIAIVTEKGVSSDQAWKEAEKGNPAKASKAGQDRYESYLKRNSKKDTPEEKAKFEKRTGYKVGAEGGEGATSAAPKFELTKFAPDEEAKFQKEMRGSEWYKEFVKRYGEEPDLDTDVYDTRRAWKLGIKPVRDKYDENSLHWPDKDPKGQWLKNPQKHPTAWMQDFMEEFGYNPEEKGITKEQYRKMTKRKASKGGSEKKSGNTAELKGNKITVGGKQYDVKDGMFTMDGKKYKVTK